MENQQDLLDLSFMETEEPYKLQIIKRRVPMRHEFLKGEEARKHIVAINQLIYFYRYFETRLEIKRGDVFLARFTEECGNELHGNHYVVALQDSSPINQVVTVVPLKSAKGKPLNPASDILLGEIRGLTNGKESIAIINQVRTIDKRRLFEEKTIASLYRYQNDEMLGEYSEITCQLKRYYRLTNEQYRKMHVAVQQYIYNGYIKH